MRETFRSDTEAGVHRLTTAFQHYRTALATLVARIVKPHDIEDIVQETYIRIYQAAQKEPIFHAKSFMLKTARNLALNHVARADALNHLAVLTLDGEADTHVLPYPDEADEGASPDTRVQAEEEFLLFCRSVRDLPLQCRRAFILRKVYGLSQREVAKHLSISESTIEKHIMKGLSASSAYMGLHGYPRASADRARLRTVTGSTRHE